MPRESRHSFECLESRRLLAVTSAYQRLIDLDDLQASQPTLDGRGQTIAVIDTGVDYRRSELGGGFGPSFKVVGGFDFVDNDADPLDTDGHGTAVASTIAASAYSTGGQSYSGIAPAAKIVALRVGVGTEGIPDSRIEQALRWVINNAESFGISVVNLSLGSGSFTSATSDRVFSDELATLADMDIFIAAASGNSGDSTLSGQGIAYPAADPNVFAVGSVNASNRISSFTQRSDLLDLLAPGEDVVLPGLLNQGFQTLDGTSFSAPAVAGSAAILWQAGAASAKDIASILISSGSSNFDGDTETGRAVTRLNYALLDLDAAVSLTQARFTSTTTTLPARNITVLDSETDRWGITHLAYYDPEARDLRYVTQNANGSWGPSVLIDGVDTDVGAQLSLALDSTGKPSIAYFDATRGDLKFARFESGTWQTRRVDQPKTVGQFPSLAFDVEDQPLIAYYARSGGNLKLASYDHATQSFSRQTLVSDGDVGAHASLAYAVVNGSVIVAIAYANRTSGDLYYTRYRSNVGTDPSDPSNWVNLLVDDLEGVSNIRLSLATNQAQIAYRDDIRGDVKFAYANAPTGGSLTFFPETIASSGSVGQQIDLYYEDQRPRIAYYNRTKDAYYVAATSLSGIRAIGSSAAWSTTRIGPGGSGLSVASGEQPKIISVDRTKSRVVAQVLET